MATAGDADRNRTGRKSNDFNRPYQISGRKTGEPRPDAWNTAE